MKKLLDSVGLTDEQGKRLERVARNEHKLATSEQGGVFKQIMIWSEMLPDPIATSEPSEPRPFLAPVIKVAQWVTNRGLKFIKQNPELRRQFLREAKPIVDAYEEVAGN